MDVEDETVTRYQRLMLDDSLLVALSVDTGRATCVLVFDAASLLPHSGVSTAGERTRLTPARIVFTGVRALLVEGGRYELNSTVVDDGARRVAADQVEFHFVLTGGTTQDGFMARLAVLASDFCVEQA